MISPVRKTAITNIISIRFVEFPRISTAAPNPFQSRSALRSFTLMVPTTFFSIAASRAARLMNGFFIMRSRISFRPTKRKKR
jgi:hypothetical protein